jgi:hypothetical protein
MISGMRRTILTLVVLAASAVAFAESAAGLQWTAPAGWKNTGSSAMRAATYAVAATPGDAAGGECGVYFFGKGQGGSVEANLDRWKNQFTVAGKPAAAKLAKRTIKGLPVTTIDTAGEYSGMGGPMNPGKPVGGYRLLGAIVEGPGGNVFLKFTGPSKTIAANEQKFEQLLNSFQRGT